MAVNLYTTCSILTIGCTLYTDSNLTSPANSGVYYDGSTCWTISAGVIIGTTSCTTTTTSTTTTTTTAPTTTTSTTTTTTTCACYEYDVDIIQTDLDNATGNSDPARNGVVFVSYRNCDDSGFTTITYSTASYYGNAFCMNSNPSYSPVFDVWQNNVQLTVTSSTAINTGNCCSFTPTTTTTTTSTTTTTTTEPPTTTTTSTTTTTTTSTPSSASLYVNNTNSLDIPITDVTVNGVSVTFVSGVDFTIPAGDNGNFETNQIGTYDIVVYYGGHISGQNITITDSNSNVFCCNLNGSAGSCTFTGAVINTSQTVQIVAADGACV